MLENGTKHAISGSNNASVYLPSTFLNKDCPTYMSDIFLPVTNRKVSTRNSFFKLDELFRKTTQGQNSLSYIGHAIWNILPENIKSCTNVNTFKHDIKEHYFNEIRRKYNLGLV